MNQSLTLPVDYSTVNITEEQWRQIIGGEPRDVHHETDTIGPWQAPVRSRAIAVSVKWGEHSSMETITLYGWRTLSRPKQKGYELEGSVSIGGKKHSAFTSSQMFRLPDGRLFDVATIHARTNQP